MPEPTSFNLDPKFDFKWLLLVHPKICIIPNFQLSTIVLFAMLLVQIYVCSSVVNPDTLNLDPDPRNFGPIWIRIQDYSVNFEKIG